MGQNLLYRPSQLNRLGNELLVILSILEKKNMPLQFFLLPAREFLTLHLIFFPRKKHVMKQNVRADISLGATSRLVRYLKS